MYVCMCAPLCVHTHGYGGQRLNSGPSHITLNHLFIYLLCVCAVGDMGLSEDSSQDFMLLPHHVILKDGTQVVRLFNECLHPESHQSYCFEIGSYWTWDSPAQLGWLTSELLGAESTASPPLAVYIVL